MRYDGDWWWLYCRNGVRMQEHMHFMVSHEPEATLTSWPRIGMPKKLYPTMYDLPVFHVEIPIWPDDPER